MSPATLTSVLVAEITGDPEARRMLVDALRDELATIPDPDRLLTPAEVAARFNVSTRTVNGWAQHGRMPAVKVGRSWRFDPDDLELAPVHRAATAEPAIRRPTPRRQAGTPHRGADPVAALLDLANRRSR
ncbi:MAG: helix-turn-helix domain-containing protein [Solirubrobacteraceae bacterium]|nr:helix-turn-helix domain-containing protein [Solirubrobacteraceae bacterium]